MFYLIEVLFIDSYGNDHSYYYEVTAHAYEKIPLHAEVALKNIDCDTMGCIMSQLAGGVLATVISKTKTQGRSGFAFRGKPLFSDVIIDRLLESIELEKL